MVYLRASSADVNPMDDLDRVIATLKKFESANDLAGLQNTVKDFHLNPSLAMVMVVRLLAGMNIAAAYHLSKHLFAHGLGNEVTGFALGLGGLLFGNQQDGEQGIKIVQSIVDSLSAEKRNIFYEIIKAPMRDMGVDAFKKKNYSFILQGLLPLFKAAIPAFRTMFDFSVSPAPVDVVAMRERGRQRARDKLLSFPSPPTESYRQPRRVLVAIRKIVLGKREFEFGPFFNQCLNAYGWSSTFFGIHLSTADEVYRELEKKCLEVRPEIIFLDLELLLLSGSGRALFFEIMINIRRLLPNIKIVNVLFDVHYLEKPLLDVVTGMSDLTWMLGGTEESYQDGGQYANRLYCPLVAEESFRGHLLPLQSEMNFSGRVFNVNWHRIFWLSAAVLQGLPVRVDITPHNLPENVDILEDYKNYNRRMAEARCCLNLSMRENMKCSFTGRPFEVILNRSLLVQEVNPVMDYYFIAGEHYLEFSSISELIAIGRFIQEQPEEAEKIRRQGFAFAQSRYNNEKIIGTIERRLFFAEGWKEP